MADMERGFYCLGRDVYYGFYHPGQVSGRVLISAVRPERIKTDVPFSDGDSAVRFHDNHALTQQELLHMEQATQKIMGCLGVHECREVAFGETEQKLGIELPREIKLLYTALCQLDSLMSGSERFLPLSELYLDEGNLVFYKIKRTPVALSLRDGVLMDYHRKEWRYHPGNPSFLCYALERLAVKAITGMPVIRKGRIGGELRTALSPKEPLRELFKGKFSILEEYSCDGNVILFHENGALGWFRQNGSYADILIGCWDDTLMSELLSTDLPVKWE